MQGGKINLKDRHVDFRDGTVNRMLAVLCKYEDLGWVKKEKAQYFCLFL